MKKCHTCKYDVKCPICDDLYTTIYYCCSTCGHCETCLNSILYGIRYTSSYKCTINGILDETSNEYCAYLTNCYNCKEIIGGVNIRGYSLNIYSILQYVSVEQVREILNNLNIPFDDFKGLNKIKINMSREISIAVCNKDAVKEMLLLGCKEESFPKEIIKEINST